MLFVESVYDVLLKIQTYGIYTNHSGKSGEKCPKQGKKIRENLEKSGNFLKKKKWPPCRNLRILNGHFSGDLLRNFTTYKNGHSYVNDYGVVSENLFDSVENFSVFPQTVFSDHAQLLSLLVTRQKLRLRHPESERKIRGKCKKKCKKIRENLEKSGNFFKKKKWPPWISSLKYL